MSHLDERRDLVPPIDPAREVDRIVGFLRGEMARLPRHNGFVVGISGGIDSALVAALAVEAAGSENVAGLMLPERESSSAGREVAREVIDFLGIESRELDLTPILDQLGVYSDREDLIRRHVPAFGSGWTYRLVLPGDLRESAAMNVYRLEVIAPEGKVTKVRLRAEELRFLQATTNIKQRVRMLELFREAERRQWIVAGTTNRTEFETGFFVRFGDGGVDIEPLAHLFKTRVYDLARHLSLPASVIERPPSPDTWSAGVSDEEFFLRMPYALVDQLLAGLDQPVAELAAACDMEESMAERAVSELRRRKELSARLRELPPGLQEDSP